MKIALVIGHNKESKGALSPTLNMTEYEYNKLLTSAFVEMFPDEYVVFERPALPSYTKQMDMVIAEIHKQGPFDLVVELHFNSFVNGQASGSMGIYYEQDILTKNIITEMQKRLLSVFGIKKRQNIAVNQNNYSKTRGGFGVMKCRYPYILIEPFFGSNEVESEKMRSYKQLANLLDKSFHFKED